jgi:hypothetical protein
MARAAATALGRDCRLARLPPALSIPARYCAAFRGTPSTITPIRPTPAARRVRIEQLLLQNLAQPRSRSRTLASNSRPQRSHGTMTIAPVGGWHGRHGTVTARVRRPQIRTRVAVVRVVEIPSLPRQDRLAATRARHLARPHLRRPPPPLPAMVPAVPLAMRPPPLRGTLRRGHSAHPQRGRNAFRCPGRDPGEGGV